MKNNKGITLLALIITIIVLLILAGVAIGMLSADEETITSTTNSEILITSAREEVVLAINEGYVEYYEKVLTGESTETQSMIYYIEEELEELEEDFDVENMTFEYDSKTITLTYSSSTIYTTITGELTENSENGVVEFDWKD